MFKINGVLITDVSIGDCCICCEPADKKYSILLAIPKKHARQYASSNLRLCPTCMNVLVEELQNIQTEASFFLAVTRLHLMRDWTLVRYILTSPRERLSTTLKMFYTLDWQLSRHQINFAAMNKYNFTPVSDSEVLEGFPLPIYRTKEDRNPNVATNAVGHFYLSEVNWDELSTFYSSLFDKLRKSVVLSVLGLASISPGWRGNFLYFECSIVVADRDPKNQADFVEMRDDTLFFEFSVDVDGIDFLWNFPQILHDLVGTDPTIPFARLNIVTSAWVNRGDVYPDKHIPRNVFVWEDGA